MPGLYRDKGVVLRTIKLGEADRIVTILTQGHGKVRAVAKGVRKTDEPVRRPARADEPRRAAVLPGPRARRRHPGRDDRRQPARCARSYGCLTHAIVDARGGRPGRAGARAERRAVPDARRARCARWRATRSPLVTPAFFWKLLSLEGVPPDARRLRALRRRRRRRPFVAFDLDEGGVLCRACARGGGRPVTPEALALLRRMLGGGLNGALAEPPGPATHEVEQLGIARARAPPRAPPAQRRAALTRRCSRRRSRRRRCASGRATMPDGPWPSPT